MDFDYDKLELAETILDALGDFDGAEEGEIFSSLARAVGNPEYWGDDAEFNTLLGLCQSKAQRYMDGIIRNGHGVEELNDLLDDNSFDPVRTSEDVQKLLAVFNA
jgi:hypothetical protein